MKTIPCAISMSTMHKPAVLQAVPAIAVGLVSAVFLHRIAVDGLFAITGVQLPFALAGASAWLYLGLAAHSLQPARMVAHSGFGIALFVAAVAGMDAPVTGLVPWFLAQSAWVLMHRRDVALPLFVAGWASFNAILALALAL